MRNFEEIAKNLIDKGITRFKLNEELWKLGLTRWEQAQVKEQYEKLLLKRF